MPIATESIKRLQSLSTWKHGFPRPGHSQVSRKYVPERISFRSATRARRSARCRILCSYKVRRRNKLLFTWKHNAFSETPWSMVRIRLLGDFERTKVHVTHVGLTLRNQQWHQDLWESSLGNLGKLF